MVFKFWFLFLFEICLSLTTSLNLPEGCNLEVEIDYSGPTGIDPTVLCSSDCDEAGKTFYYYEEILEQEYDSIVEVCFDGEGNVLCKIIPITEDILKREDLTNSTSGGETSTTVFETKSEVTLVNSSPYPDYPSQGSALEFNEFDESTSDVFEIENLDTYDSEYQSRSSEEQTTLLENENITDNAYIEYQSNESSKDDESSEESNEPLYKSEEETKIESNESSTRITTPDVDSQDEFQESIDNTNFNETSVKDINTFNTSEKVMNVGTNESEKEIVIFANEFQNEYQETDKNFETVQQEEILNSQQGINQSTSQTSFPECSKGWTLNPNSSTCYLVTQNVMNWFDANIACVQLGGVLSIFHSQEEVDFVKENVELPENSWIGLEYTLSDNLTVKTWRWIDRSVADFTDWATGEPSSETSLWDSFWAYENCVEMKSDGFAWNDARCTNMKRGLCSKKAELTARTCPDGWLIQNNRCYYFSTEELVEELADLQCSSLSVGVKLFAPQDQMEMDFVSDKLKERNMSSIWLGVKDPQEKGDFRTLEGEPQIFFSWDCKEPTNSFWWFNNKECLQMSSESKMKRAKCSQDLPFVCVLNL